MNNRIGILLKVKDVTASKFADMIGVQPSNISHILSGRNKPSLDFVMKVIETFPDISLEWLMFGKGSMFQTEQTEYEKESSENEAGLNDMQNVDDKHVPDLFNQDYPPEDLIIDSKTERDIIHENFDEEKKIQQMTVEVENKISEIEKKEVFEDDIHNRPEAIIEHKAVSEKVDPTQDKSVFENNNSQVETKTGMKETSKKPQKIIFIFEDDTFDILELREKKEKIN